MPRDPRAERDEAVRKRAEELRPDREKLAAVADLIEAIAVPEVSTASAGFAQRVTRVLEEAARKIDAIVAEMG
jgi:hypothetical protein